MLGISKVHNPEFFALKAEVARTRTPSPVSTSPKAHRSNSNAEYSPLQSLVDQEDDDYVTIPTADSPQINTRFLTVSPINWFTGISELPGVKIYRISGMLTTNMAANFLPVFVRLNHADDAKAMHLLFHTIIIDASMWGVDIEETSLASIAAFVALYRCLNVAVIFASSDQRVVPTLHQFDVDALHYQAVFPNVSDAVLFAVNRHRDAVANA